VKNAKFDEYLKQVITSYLQKNSGVFRLHESVFKAADLFRDPLNADKTMMDLQFQSSYQEAFTQPQPPM
jgi:hypothetical protein